MVEINDKVLLTIKEASELFNIGEHKLRSLANFDRDAKWLFRDGRRMLIKRSIFEDFVLNTPDI